MFIPSSKSKRSLLTLFVVAVLLMFWIENSKVETETDNFKIKLKAAKLMENAESVLKSHIIEEGYFIDEINDPNKTGLIGESQSLIVTDRGSLFSKQISLNPNFAAVIVDIFSELDLKKDDKIAINATGSFPALYLAVLSAAEVMELDLTIISSVGTSMFGATNKDLTILDMERILFEKDIFSYRSIASSIGGGDDIGRGLSREGRDACLEAISRNNLKLINEGTLEKNISAKLNEFGEKDYKLYINIGGGLSSIGTDSEMLASGLHKNIKFTKGKNGTLYEFARRKTPIVQLRYIKALANKFNLRTEFNELPKPGTGKAFSSLKYSIRNTVVALSILVILIGIIIFLDKRQLKPRKDEINI